MYKVEIEVENKRKINEDTGPCQICDENSQNKPSFEMSIDVSTQYDNQIASQTESVENKSNKKQMIEQNPSHKIPGFECNLCNRRFKTRTLLNKHIFMNHKDKIICKFFLR